MDLSIGNALIGEAEDLLVMINGERVAASIKHWL